MFKRFWWVFLVMVPVGAIAGLLVAAVVTYVMPKKYESQAIIEVKPAVTSPQFFGTEFEKIKSHGSLTRAVENLELTNKWGLDKETAIQVLKGIITIENIRGTDLISIKVRHTNKEDARDIAAEVAKSYRDGRVDAQNGMTEQVLVDLRTAVRGQEEKVEERRKVLNKPDAVALDSQDSIDAKREFESETELLQSMKLKLISETLSAKRQEDSIVIHEEPQIAQAPVSPNVPRNLTLGPALGLLFSPLLALPVILMLSRLIPARRSA